MNLLRKAARKFGNRRHPTVRNGSTAPSIFDQKFYEEITDARLQHLAALNLPLAKKTIVDVGAGIGRFSDFLATSGADVFCVDGRAENIEQLRRLYPGRRASVVDVETNALLQFGKFDIVFAYGLLYHLSDPFGFLKNACAICNEMVIVETCIVDAEAPVCRLVEESQRNVTQALHPMGCRPSPAYVIACLQLSGFAHVYSPRTLPNHEQFQYRLTNDLSYLKKGHLIRDIFVASHDPIANDELQAVDWQRPLRRRR